MQRFYSLNKFLSIFLLVLVASACRKKIDFSEGDRVDQGSLNPDASSYKPWVSVPTPGITDITLIEQNYNGIYFTGVQSGARRVFFFEGDDAPSTIWYGSSATAASGEFTALVFSPPNMYIANNAAPSAKLRCYTNLSTGTEYTLTLGGSKITDVHGIGNHMFISGDFAIQTGAFVASSYFDKVNKTTGYNLGMTGLESPTEAQCYDDLSGFFACGKNIHSGRSIANWDGTSWGPYSSLTERVTDIEMLGDTLMIAGNLSNGKAIMKERNGFEIPFDELINTAPNEAQTNIKFLKSGSVIYAYGTVNFENYTFFSVLKYESGNWSYLGKLKEIPTDLAILDGYIYAATASGIKKIKI